MDSFEPVIAFLFGAYCIRNCGAVLDDPQTGKHDDHAGELEQEIVPAADGLIACAKNGGLHTHPFEGWR